jgi:hypothetical protein
MSIKSKDLLVVVMVLFIVALLVLIYKMNRAALGRTPTKVCVMGMTEAIDRQNQYYTQLTDATRWLERHLEKCIEFIESQQGLKPIPMKLYEIPPITADVNDLEALQSFPEAPGPFVIPYKKPKRIMEKSPEEKDLELLWIRINMNTSAAVALRYDMELKIANFQERLQRLDPNKP